MIKTNKNLIFKTLALIILFLSQASLATFGSSAYYTENYYSLYYDKIDSNNFTLEKINIQNPYGDNNELLNEGASETHYGYYAGEVIVDFNGGLYNNLYSIIYPPEFWLVNGDNYSDDYFNSPYFYITSKKNKKYNKNHSSGLSVYIKVTHKDESGTAQKTFWYNFTEVSQADIGDLLDYYPNSSITLDYYFIINTIDNLDQKKDLTMIIPNFNIFNTAKYIIGRDGFTNFYESTLDPILEAGDYNMGELHDINDTTLLDVIFTKRYNSSEDFFDGDYHDYYKMNVNLYKNQVQIEDKFNLSIQVSSKNDFNLYKDGDSSSTDASKKIPYELYLKYHKSTANSSNYQLINDGDIILVENIDNANSSSIFYLTTKCSSTSTKTKDKGTYQDTIYLNFITDGIYDNNPNYDILIDLKELGKMN